MPRSALTCLYLFVEFIAGPECVHNRVLVVRRMEVKQVHTVSLQPLQGGLQLGAQALWRQSLSFPGVGLGSYAD